LFEDKKASEGNYFIKSHSNREYIPLTEKQVEIMINELECDLLLETIGLKINGKYVKTVLNSKGDG